MNRTTDDLFSIGSNFWPGVSEDPWKDGEANAPFDEEFYLILNVAVGGTNGYFPDNTCDKPWSDDSPNASNLFWDNREQWQDSWKGDAMAMQIDYIKVYPYGLDENTEKVINPKAERIAKILLAVLASSFVIAGLVCAYKNHLKRRQSVMRPSAGTHGEQYDRLNQIGV